MSGARASVAIALLVLSASASARAETAHDVFPILGDAHRGNLQFTLQCAGCHGATGMGDGMLAKASLPPPGSVRGPELAVARSDQNLFDAITQGGAGVGKSALMPAYGSTLSPLDAWDLVAYIRQGAPRVLDFFPNAGRLLAKTYTIDQYGLERLQKALGTAVPPELATLQVVTVFNGDREPGIAPSIEAQDPVTLDTLKPKDKLGYLVFVSVQLPGDETALPVAIATDSKGHIVKVASMAGVGLDAARNLQLAGLVGQGQKGGALTPLKLAVIKPAKLARGQKPKPPPASAGPLTTIDAGFARAMEAVTMYDKEERDRTWADAPSK